MNAHDRPTGRRGCALIRISDGDKQDPERQRQTIRAWADKRELEVGHWYEDIEGKNTRSKSEERRNFQRMIRDVEAGMWDWVLVDSQDRFGTVNAYEFGHYAWTLMENDCELWSVSQGHLNCEDNHTPIIGSVNATASRQEMLEKGKRCVSGKRVKAQNGEWQGGPVPYGFDVVCLGPDQKEKFRVVIERMLRSQNIWERTRVAPDGTTQPFHGKDNFPVKEKADKFVLAPSVRKERIEIAQEIFTLYATGSWTQRSLCHQLNERGICPIYGDGWYVSKLASMLRNPAYYVGQTVWGKNSYGEYAQYVGGEYIIPNRIGGKVKSGRKNAVADWIFPKHTEAIITKELWDEVQKKLVNDNPRKRGLRNPRLYLAGLLYCGRCGLRMAGWTHPKRNKDDAECYCCETFRKFGHENATGCRLHCTSQKLIEKYLADIQPHVRTLLADPYTKELRGQLGSLQKIEEEYHEVVDEMIQRVSGTGYEGKVETIYQCYRLWLQGNKPQLEQQIAAKKREMTELVNKFASLPRTARTALDIASDKIDAIQGEIDALEAELAPLTERLDTIVEELDQLGRGIQNIKERMKEGDARMKAEALRKVVARIVLHHRHYDHLPAKNSKRKTWPRSSLERIEFVPWLGGTQVISLSNGPKPS